MCWYCNSLTALSLVRLYRLSGLWCTECVRWKYVWSLLHSWCPHDTWQQNAFPLNSYLLVSLSLSVSNSGSWPYGALLSVAVRSAVCLFLQCVDTQNHVGKKVAASCSSVFLFIVSSPVAGILYGCWNAFPGSRSSGYLPFELVMWLRCVFTRCKSKWQFWIRIIGLALSMGKKVCTFLLPESDVFKNVVWEFDCMLEIWMYSIRHTGHVLSDAVRRIILSYFIDVTECRWIL